VVGGQQIHQYYTLDPRVLNSNHYYPFNWYKISGNPWDETKLDNFDGTSTTYWADDVVYLNGAYVALAFGDSAFWRSITATLWTEKNGLGGPAGRLSHHLAYGNGLYARARGRALWTASDPLGTWTQRGTLSQEVLGLDWAGGKFIATGTNGLLACSAGGGIWTQMSTGTGASLKAAAFGQGMTVAVGDGGAILASYANPTTNQPSVPVITSARNAIAVVGDPFSYSIQADNNPSLFGAVGLPPGLFVMESTGLIYGTNTVPGTNLITIAAASAGGAASNVLTLVVFPAGAPHIVASPASQTNVVGTTASFSVTAAGTAPLSYQWRFNGAPLAGQTGTNLTLPNVLGSNAGNYVVVVTNLAGSVTSAVAILTVSMSPSIATHPQSQAAWAGTAVSFDVLSYGAAPLSYQWRLNGTLLSGATNSTLQLTNLQPAHAGAYTVAVSNSYGGTVSAPAFLAVATLPTITQQPTNQQVIPGQTASLTVDAYGPGTLTFQWRQNGVPLSTGGRVSGATSNVLTITGMSLDDSGDFTVVVANQWTNLVSNPARLSVASVVMWGGSSLVGDNQTYGKAWVPDGLSNVVAVAAADTVAVALRKNGTVVAWGHGYGEDTNAPPGLSNVVAIAAGVRPLGTLASAGSYGNHSLALQADGQIAGWGNYPALVPVTLSNVVGIGAAWHTSAAIKSNGQVSVWATYYATQTNVPSSLSNVMAVSCGPNHVLAARADGRVFAWGTGVQTNVPATLTNAVAVAAGSWHSMALEADGRVVAWGDSSEGQTNVPASVSNVVAIAAGGYHCLALRADGTVIAWGEPGYDWHQSDVPIGMTGVSAIAAVADISLAAIGTTAPFFAMRPKPVVAQPGTTAYLRAEVSGRLPLTCQWQLDGQNITDATNRILVLTNLSAAQAGNYSVLAANSLGTTTGLVATVNVLTPPVVTKQPGSQTSGFGAMATFSVVAKGAPILKYQWRKDGIALTNSARIAGATNNLLSISNLLLGDAGGYTVVVTNSYGSVTSAVATLTVSVIPRLSANAGSYSNGIFRFSLTGLSGTGTCVVEASTNLVQWLPVHTNPSPGTGFEYQEPVLPGRPARFYRAVLR
ncbi:MAG: immunoglobulin domain-containing protein, partial [Verrucomicrobia bacterium]|nr:immunoglobulin domain-containing protein [Verrucomicrobiota bacterium]